MTAPQSIMQASPPVALPIEVSGIPTELKIRPQWVNWKFAWNGKKWTKVPYAPRRGQRASSTDLMTWGTFEEALENLGRYDGIGFVFCSADPFTGVDLDGCVDPETMVVSTWALQIVEGLDSYAEFSPSGTGIHIITKGKVPANGRRGPVEMYSQDRFFTVTGNVLGETS